MKKEREMYALVMKGREGRERAIKGMVMPMVRKKGWELAGPFRIRWCRGETQQLKRDVFRVTMWVGWGVWVPRR